MTEHVYCNGVRLTPAMYVILVAANGCSLPGDGLRIVVSGRNNSARILEQMGLVRVARAPGQKSRVHVTEKGRELREEIARGALRSRL